MKLKDYIKDKLGLSEFISVEIILKEENKCVFQLLHVKLNGNSLSIENKQFNLESFDELKEHLKKKIPLVLTLSGKGILIKEFDNLDKEQNIIRQILPNANTDDFSSQTWINEKGKTFCALTRNNLVESQIQRFTDEGYFVVGVNLACLTIASIIDLLDISTTKISSYEYRLAVKENQIQSIITNKYRKSDLIYGLQGLNLESELIIAFSGFFSRFILKDENIESSLISNSKSEFKNYTRFRIGKIILLAASFSILLINFFVFEHYFKKSNQLQSQLSVYSQTLKKKDDLQESLRRKEESIKTLGLKNNIKFSYVADHILKDMPSSIKLSLFDIQPKVKTRKRELFFDERKILIKGSSHNTELLNQWIKKIKLNEWVKECSLSDYTYDEYKHLATFQLNIELSQLKFERI